MLAADRLPLHVRARPHGRLPSCSSIADGFEGVALHLANHDVTLTAVSRAPLAQLQAFKRRTEWTFLWASSFGSDFNADFDVWFTEEQQRAGDVAYNYRRESPQKSTGREGPETLSPTTADGPAKGAAMSGTDVATYTRESLA